MNVQHATGRPTCPRCKGRGVLVVKSSGGEQRLRCVSCGGSGGAGPRTK